MHRQAAAARFTMCLSLAHALGSLGSEELVISSGGDMSSTERNEDHKCR